MLTHMGRGILPLATVLLFAFCEATHATTFTAEVTDQDNRPVINAVVTLIPDAKSSMPAASTRLATDKTIDQRNETFLPTVTIVPKGGHIVFANNDQTTHQVYSFSAAKQFEITLARGEKSSPIAFDNAGIAALGCNIHDHMIAYAFVAESPWAALTGSDGKASVSDVPPGAYQVQVWHPKFPPGRQPPSLRATLSGDNARMSVNVRLLPAPTATRGHAGSY
jgi:plastocyanin